MRYRSFAQSVAGCVGIEPDASSLGTDVDREGSDDSDRMGAASSRGHRGKRIEMKLTRLRLIGLQSFVEPTAFLIEPGLTGVVGPNGCGKSNLVEALRWVMGETSHKSMRAAEMDDVIFSGTNNRPARNTAEVAIQIDNSKREAPTQFNEYDTLDISRRIER